MKRRIQAELSISSSPEKNRNVHFLDNKQPEPPIAGWAGSNVEKKRDQRPSNSKILQTLVSVALLISCYSAWKSWTLNAAQIESDRSAVSGYEVDQLFLTGRVANLEQKIQTFSAGLMSMEGSEGMEELKVNLDALIITFGEIAMELERHNERLVKVEAEISEIASLGERLGELEKMSNSRQGSATSAQRQATAGTLPKAQEQEEREASTAAKPKISQSISQAPTPQLAASPWIIMALSENSAFVRDKNTGQQHLLRVSSNTEACGNVTEINITDQELITEQCAPARR